MQIPLGLCGCGCGQRTPIANGNDRTYGAVKGQPRRFVVGHRTPPPPFADRFWARVQKGEGCWEWSGARLASGYGVIYRDRLPTRNEVLAHRASWEIHNGPIPDGLWVLHRCDNPPCVRPDHLFIGTNADNQRDMDAKGRRVPPPNRWKHRAA